MINTGLNVVNTGVNVIGKDTETMIDKGENVVISLVANDVLKPTITLDRIIVNTVVNMIGKRTETVIGKDGKVIDKGMPKENLTAYFITTYSLTA